MSFKEKFLNMYRSDRVLLGEWILVIVTGVFVFITSSTWDSQSLTQWSVNVWDVIADGKFRDYYAYTAENVYAVHHAHMGSEIMSVLPWSVWNLPIWIVQRFFDKPIIDSPLMLAWSKLFLVGLSVVTLIFTKKITQLITGSKSKSTMAVFLAAGSTYLYLSVCYQGQNDIMMITASVLAVYCLLKNKQRAFMLWSVLAISIKPFFVLPFLAVVILTEKKILHIFLKAVISVSGLAVQKLIFRGAPGYAESMESGPAKEMLEEMFTGSIKTAFGSISLFAIALVLIYFYAYTRDFDRSSFRHDSARIGQYVVYIITLTYASYLSFSPFSFYRVGILVPYLFIVIVQNDKHRFYNSVFDIVMQFSLVMKLILRGSKMFSVRFVNKSLVQSLLGYTVDYDSAGVYKDIDAYLYENNDLIEKFQPLFSGLAIICTAMLLILNHPEDKVKLKIKGVENTRALLWIRTLIILPFALLTMHIFIKAHSKMLG